ncbi:MAG TPA: DUF3515 domain-containing protein [Jiangellaceae bacterium]|nr:DUF3515 domain-containing protein [Jiangellaceae bacterium]
MPGRSHLIGAVLGAALLVGGCGFGGVDVEPYEAEPGTEQACAALVDALPDVVSDAVRRDVETAPERTAAWGDPPIVLRCGVPLPAQYRPDSQLLDVDGVGWFPVDGEGGTFFTAADRMPYVEVAVPEDYAPEAEVLVDLAAAITSAIPAN